MLCGPSHQYSGPVLRTSVSLSPLLLLPLLPGQSVREMEGEGGKGKDTYSREMKIMVITILRCDYCTPYILID